MDNLYTITGIVVLAILCIGIVVYFMWQNEFFQRRRKAKDLPDSKKADKPLGAARRMALMNGYQLIAPACLAKDGKLADLDFIVVGTFGLLCVKCVGRGGSIYGSAGDAMWLQVKNDDRISFANPMLEAERDTRLVRDILFSAKLKGIPVETVCVFTNPSASLALPRSTGHYTVKEFRSLLGQSRFLQERKIDLEAVCKALRSYVTEKK
ncbi:nuclease-related domain-containing protein [uncultured Ruthenibacterium sp.]|uniref:nuclease-related domain-containing protein n=1 Tax=uncultured Ruthenibacterium sp. TaxID=1905347 RepID=UPI00349F0422